MHRQSARFATITVVVLSASQAAAAQAPYSNGRLTHVAYVELAAKADVISEMKNYASSQGWTVDCEKRAGNLLTMRLRFAAGTRQKGDRELLR
jgi:hypothetical protein